MTYKRTSLHLITFALLILSVAGCSNHNASFPLQPQSASKSISVLNLKSLQNINSITPVIAKKRVVFVGEQHDQYGDHLNQLAVIKNLHKHWGKSISIGIEMVQRPFQSSLDNYIAGTITEREMLKGVEWYDRWRYDFRLYQPIFEYAKANKIPLVALNIPTELTKKITKVGIAGLNKSERLQLPDLIDRSNKDYMKRITSVFGRHSHTSSKGVKKFIDAQLAWDEGMAFSAAKYLNNTPRSRMVIIAGGGHVINRSGIPDRLDRQIKSNSVVILNHTNNTPSPKQGDYLLLSPEETLPSSGKIGIVMGKAKNGVLVKDLSPHGAAIKSGIQKNDLLLAIDGQTIKTQSDVLLWGFDKKPNDIAELKLRRNNQIVVKKVTLKSSLPFNKHSKH